MSDAFGDEIASIKARYAEFEASGVARSTWAPFTSEESDVRMQQQLVFSRLMREAGLLDLEGLRIFDLGCGSGRHLRQFMDMGSVPDDLYGIDLDDAAVAKGNMLSPQIHISLATGAAIDFPDANFDLVTHHFVFSSVPSDALRRQLMSEIRRVLKPGGLFYWWDMMRMANAAGGAAVALDFADLIPEQPIASLGVAMTPPPSDTLRPLPLLRKVVGPVLDLVGNEKRFQAALFRLP